MQGRKNYQEKLFTSFQLSDRIPEQNLYRKILKIVDFHFLYKETAKYYGTEGQESIDPVVCFKLMLFGYLENLNSDRKIVDTAALRMDILFFIGYDIDEPLPWHSTLSRTRNLYGQDVFMSLFQKVLKQCAQEGMMSGKRQAIDSFLIKANASMDSLVEKKLREDVELYGQELISNEDFPDQKVKVMPKPKQSINKEKGNRSNKTHYSPSDPDSRLATKPGKPTKLNYLGQVSVDTSSYLITHAQTFLADQRDSDCFESMVRATKANLADTELTVQQVLADTNYSSPESFKVLKNMDIDGFIPNHGAYKPERKGFTFDQEKNGFICSQGKFLSYRGIRNNRSPSKRYVSNTSDCKLCPIKRKCIGNAHYKMITETIYKPYYQKMEEKIHSKKGRRMMRIRHSTVEPVIGDLVNNRSMRKVNTIGITNANKSLIMASIAHNIKRLIKHSTEKPEVWVKEALIIPEKIAQILKSQIVCHYLWPNFIA